MSKYILIALYIPLLETLIFFGNTLHTDGDKLTGDFSGKWEGPIRGIKGALRPTEPLKIQVDRTIKFIEAQLGKVNERIENYIRREKELSEKIVQAYEKHDDARAKIIANELAEIRKHKDLLINSKLSLDKAVLRLRTLYELGNFTSIMNIAKRTVGEIRVNMAPLIPGINPELMQIERMLDEIMMDISRSAGENLNFDVEGVEAEKILEEAAIVAKSRMRMKFPDLPRNGENNGVDKNR